MDKNLFISTEIHSRKVTIGKEDVTLFFKELPGSELRKYYLLEDQGTIDQKAENMARLISLSLVDEAGAQVMDVAKARTLKGKAMIAIFNEVIRVNRGEDDEGKQS